jgi:peroxiredoxin
MRNWTLTAALSFASATTLLVALPTLSPAAHAQESQAVVGQPAPSFTLQDEEGTTHSLEQYRGKIVVLEWTNPQCPFIVRHYNAGTMANIASHAGDDMVFFAVNSSHFNTAADSQAWKEQRSLTFPTLQDSSGDVGRLYGARTTPHMYVIDAEGVLAYAGAVDDDPRGGTTEPTNHVLAAVTALRSGARPDPSSTQPYGCTVKYE